MKIGSGMGLAYPRDMMNKPIAMAVTLGCTTMLWCASGYGSLAQDFATKLNVDIRRFAGAWYELARTPNQFQDVWKKKGGKVYSVCYNVRTEFIIQNPEKVRLWSFCSRKSTKGDVTQDMVEGLAVVVDDPTNRKFKLTFGSAPMRALQRMFADGGKNYWIYCVGPINEEGRYDWAITGAPKREFIFLLTRNRTVPERTKAKMLACARREGIPVDQLIYLQR